mgnify:CR=1 FL=1
MARTILQPICMTAAAQLRESCALGAEVRIWWLGQAGFCVSGAGLNILVDPYLSDHLAQKYRGREFSHIRMMPSPVRPEDARAVDYVLCTHRHGDHMDPEALRAILKTSAECRLVGPAAERSTIYSLVPDVQRAILVNGGDELPLERGNRIEVIASAHEQLTCNDRGEHHFVGYIIQLNGTRIYHSGDCVPYPGLVECLRSRRVHLALLPVNGRDPYLADRGVAGNFQLEEALDLFLEAEIPAMICHHFGMFRFNTVPTRLIQERLDQMNLNERVLIPSIYSGYLVDCR